MQWHIDSMGHVSVITICASTFKCLQFAPNYELKMSRKEVSDVPNMIGRARRSEVTGLVSFQARSWHQNGTKEAKQSFLLYHGAPHQWPWEQLVEPY
eukprot:6476904-Amphidinium_carterae.1